MRTVVQFITGSLLLAGLLSCSKEKDRLPEPTPFAHVIFKDPFGIFAQDGPLRIEYQDVTLPNDFVTPLTVLPGEGKFEFFYSASGNKALEKQLNISKDTIKTYVFFKPDADKDVVELLENNQSAEPLPAENYIKVKMANFAESFFNRNTIKVVFSQNSIPVDTITLTGSAYTAGYSEMARAFTTVRGQKRITPLYQVTYLDENNQPILDTNNQPVLSEFFSTTNKTVYTVFITRNPNGGYPMFSSLFEN
jgi:hypothetical protein